MRLFFLFTVLSFFSCVTDDAAKQMVVIDYELLIGSWDLASASRDGKKTETLNGTFLNFSSIDSLSTNMFGDDMPQQLIWQDSIGVVSDSSVLYRLVSIQEDTLRLAFSLQRRRFDLLFVKRDSLEYQLK